MTEITIEELLNAVVNDIRLNGMREYPHICDYLHGHAPAPYSYNYIAWNTAEGLIDWDVLDEARDNGDIEGVARIVADYVVESYDRHCEWCSEGEDEEAFDDMLNKCDKYISDINRQMLSEILLGVSLGRTITGERQFSPYIPKSPATDDIPPEKAIAYRIGFAWRINVERLHQFIASDPQILR
jgi:hypothetical protein